MKLPNFGSPSGDSSSKIGHDADYDNIQTTPTDSNKAELLQLKPHPFICTRNFITKKVANRRN